MSAQIRLCRPTRHSPVVLVWVTAAALATVGGCLETPETGGVASLSQALSDPECPSPGYNVIVGTPKDDTLIGTEGNDCIVGKGGNDYIDGRGGDDLIFGDDGDDILIGGDGNDRISGGKGKDTIEGGAGDDVISGGPGADVIHGGAGNDVIDGGGDGNGDADDADLITGDEGNDAIADVVGKAKPPGPPPPPPPKGPGPKGPPPPPVPQRSVDGGPGLDACVGANCELAPPAACDAHGGCPKGLYCADPAELCVACIHDAECVHGKCSEACQPAAGCQTPPLDSLPNCGSCGNDCDDGNPCTTDLCDASGGKGACVHVDVRACGGGCGPIAGCGVTDTDGDGLNDVWERNGYIDLNCNGRQDEGIDTPLPGADVNRPNVYVKWDAMYAPGSGAACAAKADCPGSQLCRPVNNILRCVAHDGISAGSNARCQSDLDCPGDECGDINGAHQCVAHNHMPSFVDTPTVTLSGNPITLSAALTQVQQAFAQHHAILTYYPVHDSIPEFQVTSLFQPGKVPACAGVEGVNAVSLYTIKEQTNPSGARHMPDNLRPVYHYGLLAHWNSCQPGACSSCPPDFKAGGGTPLEGATGLAELPGNDFLVTLGNQALSRRGDMFFAWSIAVPFMHELGHNMGLRHGGADDINRKPNYVSVMNYNFSSGIPYGSPNSLVTACDNSNVDWYRIDYSDFLANTLNLGVPSPGPGFTCVADPQNLAPGLNEILGITGRAMDVPGANDLTVFQAGDQSCLGPTNGSPVDWNPGDGGAQTQVYSNLGVDWAGPIPSCTIAGYNDWDQTATTVRGVTSYRLNHLTPTAPCNSGNWADGAPAPYTISYDEPAMGR